MKKRGLYIFFILLFLGLTFVAADSSSNITGVDKAYQCLSNKINNSCSTLTDEEKAFSLLAIGQCQSDITSDAKSVGSGDCWPASGCSIKTTSQVLLALHNSGGDISGAQNWLYTKNQTPTQLVWYLEIDSRNATSCTIKYPGGSPSYTVNIDQNKVLSSGAGNCLALSQNGYLLQVSPSCYNEDFQISCSKDFLTTTLFQKSTSSTIYVTDTTNSAASGGTTTENVKSLCFSTGTTCDYEGTLWAALGLNAAGQDVSAYLPYLIVMADENQQYLPDAFLYALTAKSQYETSLLSLQQSSEYWQQSGDRYYDTALALYPLANQNPQEKTNAQSWLLGTQDPAGCWNSGNIRDTAFVLASSWPRQFSSGGGPGLPDCTTAGYSCTLPAACSSANTQPNYQCSSSSVCCTVKPPQQTCAELGGNLCSSGQTCGVGGAIQDSADTTSSSFCCVGATCITTNSQPSTDCVSNNGICRAGGCATGEQSTTNYQCSNSGDICCVISTTGNSSSGGSSLWIWILVILIILIALGIIFRKKLRAIIFKEGGKSAARPGQPPRGPPYYPQRPMQRMPERRIMIPQQRPSPQPVRRPSKSQGELDEVLRKLKEMGK